MTVSRWLWSDSYRETVRVIVPFDDASMLSILSWALLKGVVDRWFDSVDESAGFGR